jgi:hypothetical protein
MTINIMFSAQSKFTSPLSPALFTDLPVDAGVDYAPKQPAFSKTAGFDLGVPVPPELQGLTFAEHALIAMIQVAVPARKLKLGDRALTGHVSFFDRTSNITDVANVLPRLAADVKVMEFTAQVGRAVNHTYRDFRVRRYKVEGALRWLCANSPAYIGVTISIDNLALLPQDGQLEVTVIQVTEEPSDDEDKGPAEELPHRHPSWPRQSRLRSQLARTNYRR